MGYKLATTLADVEEYLQLENEHGFMGMDTEASSLNTNRAKMAGISLSLLPETGIYIPTGHKLGTNLPLEPVWERIKKKIETYTPVFHNAKYDLTILQVATGEAIKKFGDSLELVYLADPDRKEKGLKDVARDDFGVKMEEFEDLFSDEERKSKRMDITTRTPQRVANYASQDADMGLQTWLKYHWVTKEFKMASEIDHLLIDIVRKMEHNGGMILNDDYIQEQIAKLDVRAEALAEQIHRIVGYQFEINSPKQLGNALFEKMGLPSQGMTRGKNPMHTTNEESLEKLRTAYPVVEAVISYKKVIKAKSSYFLKLQKLSTRKMKPRFNFNIFAAPTFRFAAPGGDPDRDGATGVNIQAVSDGEDREMFGVDLASTGTADSYLEGISDEDILLDLRPEIVTTTEVISDQDWREKLKFLPYVVEADDRQVCFRETCAACLVNCAKQGVDVTRRLQKDVKMVPSVRQAFRAPPGYKMVSFDYDRQELVIGANMSGEPRWLKALANGEDLHASTAAAAFGMSIDVFNRLPDAEKKRKRGIGKTLNFATFYGATAYTLKNKADIPLSAAEAIYDGFVRNHRTLFSWMEKVHIFARKNGFTTTYFGRKRHLKRFYDGTDRKMKAFGDRSAVNTAIQGTAAEITRIAMVKVDKRLRNAGYTWKDVKFAIQIHDELAFLVRNELVKDVVPIIKQAMEFEVKSWRVQLTVGPKMGDIWGRQKEIKLEDLDQGKYDHLLVAA